MVAICSHCWTPAADLITDTHRPVCPRCVASLGRIAADPASAHPQVVRRLEARSLDVLHLAAGRWVWTSHWPGTGAAG